MLHRYNGVTETNLSEFRNENTSSLKLNNNSLILDCK